MATIFVKVSFEDEVRRFELQSHSWKELLEKITHVFALKNASKVVIKYQDNEGDLVTIATDSELDFALKHQLQDNILRLSLFRKPAAVKASCTPVAKATVEVAPTAPATPAVSTSAPSPPSEFTTSAVEEDKMTKLKEKKEQRKKMKEDLKEMKKKFRVELKNPSDDSSSSSSSDEEKQPKDPQAIKECLEERRKMCQQMREMKRKMKEGCKKNVSIESNHGLKHGDVITLMSSADRHNREGGLGWHLGINEKGELASNHASGISSQWVVEEVGRASICLSAASNRNWHLRIIDDGTVNGRGGTGRWARFIPEICGDKICFRRVSWGENGWYLGVNADGAVVGQRENNPFTQFTVTKITPVQPAATQ